VTTSGLHPALEPIDTCDWTRLEAFLSQRLPEDERLDYKDRIGPTTMETAAAMANTRGGTIIVGVREDPTIRNIPGAWEGTDGDPQGAINSTNWAYCSPAVRMRLLPLTNPTTSKTVLIVAVEPALHPPYWHRDKGIQTRVGDQNRPAAPELLEAWYSARAAGNASENALRRRATAATTYGSPAFSLHLWPVAAVPTTQLGPASDAVLDRLAKSVLDADRWEGHPSGSEYVLEAERDDRHLLAAVDQQAYVRYIYAARLQPPAASVDLVVSTQDLVMEYLRRLVFAELALDRVCDAPAPFRVELLIHYGSDWRVTPPSTAMEYRDPIIPTSRAVEAQAVVETTMSGHGAAETAETLLTLTLRRLGWRRYDSYVTYVTSTLRSHADTLYASA
jgi:hypothetical protein